MGIIYIVYDELDKFGFYWFRVVEYLFFFEVIYLFRRVNFLLYNELLYVVTVIQGEEVMVFEVKVEVI